MVDRARDQLLAGAGLAGHQNRAGRRRHGLEHVEQLTKDTTLADDPFEAVTGLELRAQIGVLVPQPALLEGAVQDVQELLALERFRDQVDGAPLYQGDGIPDGAVAGHDDDEDVRVAVERGVEDAGAGQARQPQVGQDDVEGEPAEGCHRLFAGVGLDDVEAGVGEQVGECETQRRLVLDEQQMRFLFRAFTTGDKILAPLGAPRQRCSCGRSVP